MDGWRELIMTNPLLSIIQHTEEKANHALSIYTETLQKANNCKWFQFIKKHKYKVQATRWYNIYLLYQSETEDLNNLV